MLDPSDNSGQCPHTHPAWRGEMVDIASFILLAVWLFTPAMFQVKKYKCMQAPAWPVPSKSCFWCQQKVPQLSGCRQHRIVSNSYCFKCCPKWNPWQLLTLRRKSMNKNWHSFCCLFTIVQCSQAVSVLGFVMGNLSKHERPGEGTKCWWGQCEIKVALVCRYFNNIGWRTNS